MNPFLESLKTHSANIYWKTPHQSLTYLDIHNKVTELSDLVELPERTLVAVQEHQPLEVLIQVLTLWTKDCVPVLIPADTPADLMNEYEKQVPFGENCPEGNLVFFTSGSQGTPKGIVHSYETLFNSAKATNDFYHLQANECWGLSLPVHHTGGFMIMLRTLLAGASVFHAQKWREVVNYQTDFYSLVPTQLQESISAQTLQKARVVLIGGAAMGQDTLDLANQNKIPVHLSYGMTETAAQITSTDAYPKISNLAGHPLQGSQIELDEQGLIKIKSNCLMVGLYTQGIFHEPDLENDWFIQKDLGELTPDGLLIHGRSDRIFISGGENINPISIEKALMDLSSVHSAFVEPVSDQKFGTVPLALIEANPEDLELIQEEMNYRLPKFMQPKDYMFFKWDYEKSLKPDHQYRSLLTSLYEQRQSVHFHFETFGTLGKPVVLLLHGFMGSLDAWREVINELKVDFFLIALDLPGHGKTKAEHYSSKQDFLNELNTFTKALAEFNPMAIGYSMGGRMLLQHEKQFPGLFSILILESVHPGLTDSNEKSERLLKDQSLLDGLFTTAKFRDFLEKWYDLPLFSGIKFLPNYEELIKTKIESRPEELQRGLNLLSTGHQDDCRNVFTETSTPLVYLAGENDEKYKAFADEIKSLSNENVQVVVVPYHSHNIHFQSSQLLSIYLKAALI
jgi:2-succinyl-6-hydroxy-2,4-cyclohexadiene-1-carboxylate synthase